MMKPALLLTVCVLIASCSGKEDKPGLGKTDSLLIAPLVEQPGELRSPWDSSGLIIDSSTIRQQRDRDLLHRFTPKQVLDLYESYRPMRNGKTSEAQLDSFLKAKQITQTELHSVLAEGDRLGWSGAH